MQTKRKKLRLNFEEAGKHEDVDCLLYTLEGKRFFGRPITIAQVIHILRQNKMFISFEQADSEWIIHWLYFIGMVREEGCMIFPSEEKYWQAKMEVWNPRENEKLED